MATQIPRKPLPAAESKQPEWTAAPVSSAPFSSQSAALLPGNNTGEKRLGVVPIIPLSSSPTPAHSSGFRSSFAAWLDRTLPPHRRYCRMRRRTFLIVLAAAVLALVVLIVGLAAGLTVRNKNASPGFLPLPSDTQQFTGDLTYFGDGLGACGVTSTPDQDIVAVSHFLFDAEQGSSTNPNSNPLCGLMIRAERFDEQVGANRSVDLTVVDRCVGCQPTDLDVSTGAFTQLADMAAGRVTVTWAWLEPVPTASAR